MKKTIILLLSLLLAFAAASCSATSPATSDEGNDSGYWQDTGVTGSGYEYTASVDQDALDRSFAIKAIQGENLIEPRDEIDAETIEEDNAYQMIDAGTSIECDYWFPVDASQPVTIQILNIDGEDTVMAELTFPVSEDDQE